MADGGYPIVLDVADRRVVIVGGGAVALRKVKGLLESGAKRIRVVSPTFHPEMPISIERIMTKYCPEHLTGASLVFAATDSPEVNEAVVRDARQIGAWVCRADGDDDNAGDFSTPAMFRQGAMLIAVSSGGSPALSAVVRDKLKRTVDPRWAPMALAMKELRPMIRKSLELAHRKQVFLDLCTDEALDELVARGLPGLKSWLGSRYAELKDVL